MPNIVRAVDLEPEEIEMLGVNIEHAIESGDAVDIAPDLAAVNRSLAIHNEGVDHLPYPPTDGRAA